MIDYLYSRMIVTIASIALVGIVVSASYGATEQAARISMERIADDICQIVEKARNIGGNSYRQSIILDDDLAITINVSYIKVEKGRFSASQVFDEPVTVMLAGRMVNSAVAIGGSTILLTASKGIFDKENSITISVL